MKKTKEEVSEVERELKSQEKFLERGMVIPVNCTFSLNHSTEETLITSQCKLHFIREVNAEKVATLS